MKSWRRVFGLLILLAVIVSAFSMDTDISSALRNRPAAMLPEEASFTALLSGVSPQIGAGDRGPIVIQAAEAYAWNGDLRDLPQRTDADYLPLEVRRPVMIKDGLQPSTGIIDPLAQTEQGLGRMPEPLSNLDGIHYGEYGGWHPPETTGDVGPNHYTQVVNGGIGIFDKATGTRLVGISYDDFFQGPPNSQCDSPGENSGDPIVNYDPMADRWIISDFAQNIGSHQCFAVSQTGDPVSGGWYFYDIPTQDPTYGSWCDYPKIGVWPDAYYMTCNMFTPWIGSNVFALDRAAMLIGAPVNVIMFRTGSTDYMSLLPANVRGPLPPAGSPNYLATTGFPNLFRIWEFHVDWATPGNSTLTGPVELEVAPFGYIHLIPQPGGHSVMSLGDRPMHFLQYRNYGDHEALFVNQVIPSGVSSGIRWYEVRDPGGKPVVYQQGTYAPDDDYRWMGSIAADQDGNVAVGYSVSSLSLYPAIRYTGRLNGEVLGQMTQGEVSLIEGGGSQTGSNRWGDYSSMSVDPVDDCTFWYTQEYFPTSGGAWYTRIGSFKFPSCGLPKGWIAGTVYNSITGDPIADVPVVVAGTTIAMTMTVQADANGSFVVAAPDGSYDLTAGPLLPGYPGQGSTVAAVTVGNTTNVGLYLDPVPYLVSGPTQADDTVSGGNGNGFPEPGESSMNLLIALSNTGALTATGISAHLVSLTPGVTVELADAGYPDTGIGVAEYNLTPYVFSIDQSVPCGTPILFEVQVTTDQGSYTVPVHLYARVALPRESYLADDMENGEGGWVHGGQYDLWAITAENSHSPTHAWSDSPNGNYRDSGNNWLRSPVFDLTLQTGFRLSYWHRYDLEAGYDFGYVEYSTDGGSTWERFPVLYTGSTNDEYVQETLDAAVLDDHSAVSFRFRIETEMNTNLDGWHIDDVDLSYEPYACYYVVQPAVPVLVAPADGTVTTTHDLTLSWQPGDTLPVDYYRLDVDGTVVTTTDLSAPVTLTAGTHDWTVSACGESTCSAYALPWTVEVEILDPPGEPTLLYPPDGSFYTTTHTITFTWEAGSGGLPDGYNLIINGVVYTTSQTYSVTTLPAGTYTWTVRAFNAMGQSAYSPPWGGEILDPAGVPLLLAPADDTVTTTQNLTLTWESGTGGAPDGYVVEVDGVTYTTTQSFLSMTLSVGTHTWRVRAYNEAGYTAYSAEWTVTVEEEVTTFRVFLPVVEK